MSETPGLDLDALRTYLDRERPGLFAGDLRAEVIAGGRSNLTYVVTDGSAEWVVRRPPLGHVLATAHDMGREHRVISALGPTSVPVPGTVLLCEDTDVLGAPFYVMEKVTGTPYRYAAELDRLGVERTRQICLQMVDILATLHRIDPAEVGLADFGRPDGFLARQVRRWKKQLDASRSRELPGMDDLHARLEAGVPQQQAAAVVHGDYRLDNLLVDTDPDGDDRVTAVLDWEMATLGDPLTDVALLIAYRGIAMGPGAVAVADAPRAPGFLSTRELLDRYAENSERDLSAMSFYVALAYFKLGVILEGIHYRYTQGKTVGAGFEQVGQMVGPIVEAGQRAFEEDL
ncbi:MAG TPA: phosphotransferase family protein [Nocardioidaceae bacterium]|nr:phosphotransferase family protein [Nocardioidaceae bacterium]